MTALATSILADSWGFHHGDMGIGWWIVMMLGMVIFWGAVIAVVVWVIRGGVGSRSEEPLEVLRQRLADGSISVEEYEQRRGALEGSALRGGESSGGPAGDELPGSTAGQQSNVPPASESG